MEKHATMDEPTNESQHPAWLIQTNICNPCFADRDLLLGINIRHAYIRRIYQEWSGLDEVLRYARNRNLLNHFHASSWETPGKGAFW